jgi:PEGA domain
MKPARLVMPFAGAARRAAVAGALALGAVVHTQAAAAAPQAGASPAGDTVRARELYRKGRDEYAKDRLPQAFALFLEAWGLQKSFDIAGNLAVVEMKLARYREAAEHGSFALANFPAGGTDAQRKAVQDLLVEARTYVGTVTVRVSVDRAVVTVDGKAVGESPLPFEVFVDPGAHTFAATAPGCEPVQDTVRTDKGTTHLLTLTPVRCGPTPPPVLTPVTATGPDPITATGFVVTGLGLGLGAAFAILSKIKATDADTQAQSIAGVSGSNPKACAGASPSTECSTLGGLRASEATFADAALWTFVAAGAVGAGTLIYTFAIPHAASTPKGALKASRAQLIPLAGPGVGGVLLKGAF